MRIAYVYVIGREDGPVKVGYSVNPEDRIKELQSGAAFKLEIFHLAEAKNRKHAYTIEHDFHAVFSAKRLFGEWFDMNADSAAEGVDICMSTEQHFSEMSRGTTRE